MAQRPAGEGEYSELEHYGVEEEKAVEENPPIIVSSPGRRPVAVPNRRPSRGNSTETEINNPLRGTADEEPRVTISDYPEEDIDRDEIAMPSTANPMMQTAKGSANAGQAQKGGAEWAGKRAQTGRRSMGSVVTDVSPGVKAFLSLVHEKTEHGMTANMEQRAHGVASQVKSDEGKQDMFVKLAEDKDDADLDDQIRIGDQVLLGCISNGDMVDCIVTADGFFTESASVVSECSYYYLATFRVTPALQYDALSEHTAMQDRIDNSGSRETFSSAGESQRKPSMARRQSSLRTIEAKRDIKDSHQAVEDERNKNSAKLIKLEKDTKEQAKIHYADDFQLYHMPSGKFLTATDRGDFTVTEGGTKNSIFRAKPRYRFREDGDGVLYADEVLLTVPQYGNQMLSVTKLKVHPTGASQRGAGGKPTAGVQLVLKEQPSPDDVHVSLSGENRSFSFRFNKVARYTYDKAVPNPVKTDRMLKLWCHAARGVLCAPHDPISDDQNAYAETSESGVPATMDSEELAYFATSIWQLEEEHAATGSTVYWEKSYRLRHSLSLRYLSIGGEPLAVGADENDIYYAAVLISPDEMEEEKEKLKEDSSLSSKTLFKFKNTELLQNRVMNLDDCTFRMFNERKTEDSSGKPMIQKCYLHFEKIGTETSALLNGGSNKDIHMCFQTKESTEDTLHVLPPDATFQKHLRTLRAFQNGVPEAKMYITAFESLGGANRDDETLALKKQLMDPAKATEHQKRREADMDELRHFLVTHEGMLRSVKIMLQVMITTCLESNKEPDRNMDDEKYLELEGSSRKDFQDLARESKALEALMAMILAPMNCKNKTVKEIKNWHGDPEFDTLRGMQDLCFKVLRVLVAGNEKTELYIAEEHCALRFWPDAEKKKGFSMTPSTKRFSNLEWPWYDFAFPTKSDLDNGEMHTCETWVSAIILCARHLAKAQECLSTLLSNNEVLLDKFVDDDTVDSFIDNIQEKGPEHSTMDFFHAICSCKGRQILSNQELCLKKLLHDGETRHQLMVETTVFPCEMFEYARDQICEKQVEEPEFKDFIKEFQGMPDLKKIFDRASEQHGGTLGLKELRLAFQELHVELSRKDIKFVLDRADTDDNDGSLNFDEFQFFIVTHLHPEWEIGFERTKEYARRHQALVKQPWNYSTEDLVNYRDDTGQEPYRSRVKNQAFSYGDKKKGNEKVNEAFSAPSSFLGDGNLVDVYKPGETIPRKGDIIKAKRTPTHAFEPAIITKVKHSHEIKIRFPADKQEMNIDPKKDQIRKEVLEFNPVFLGWTGSLGEWTSGQDQLYFSPSDLGLVDDFGVPYTAVKNQGALGGSEYRAWVPIERVCWVLSPKKLFMKVMLPRVFEKKLNDVEVPTLKDYIKEFSPPEEEGQGGADNKTAGEKTEKAAATVPAPNSGGAPGTWRLMNKQRSTKLGANYHGHLSRIHTCYDPIFEAMDAVHENGTEISTIPKNVKKWCEKDVELWWYSQRNMEGLIIGDLEALDARGKEKFDDLVKLATYYQSQIALFAEMCLDRSYNSIYEMQRQFSYDTLVSLVSNDLLPDALRSAFTLLLLRVYIDRYPHAPIQAPNAVQVFDDADGIAGNMVIKGVEELNGSELLKDPGNGMDGYFGILPQFHIPRDGPLSKGRVGTNMNLSSLKFLMFGISENENPGQKFYLMEEFITSFLLKLGGQQEPGNAERNRFVLSILDMIQSLVKFGFYGTYYELMDVTTPLVELLNGSNDMDPEASEEAPEDAAQKRYSMGTPGNKLVMESKIAIIQSLMNLNRIRDDYRQKIIMAYFKESLTEWKTEGKKEFDIGKKCLFFPALLADEILEKEEHKIEDANAGTGVTLVDLIKKEQDLTSGGLAKLKDEWERAHNKEEMDNQMIEAAKNEDSATTTQAQAKRRQTKRRSTKHPTLEGEANLRTNVVEWCLSSHCQHCINDIFEEIESVKEKMIEGIDPLGRGQVKLKWHDYAKLDLDTMSPSEDLVAICMDMMMYDLPELFESAFSLLWSQFAQREPVIEALQDVMLLESPTLYENKNMLVVQWLVEVGSDPAAIRRSDPADLWASRCTMGHVKHLNSFKQLLRRGVEAYELWGKHDDNESHFHSAYNDASNEAYSVIHDNEPGALDSKKVLSEKTEWYLKNMAYITLFMKFMTSEESVQSKVTDNRYTVDLPMEMFWATKAGPEDEEEVNTTSAFEKYVVPDQKKHILDVEKVLQEIELDEEIMDEIADAEGHKVDPEKIVQLVPLDPLTRDVNRVHQKIMFGFQIHHVLLSALEIPIHKGISANTFRCLRQIVALALDALRIFVLHNKKNQNEIYESIDVILKVIVNNCKGCDMEDDDGEGDDQIDSRKGSDTTGSSAKKAHAGNNDKEHPLDKPTPPKNPKRWDLDGWSYCGVDLIDMVEAYAVDLICELFVENTELCDQASQHHVLFDTMRQLCLKRLPDLRALRFFHILSAHGTSDTKSRIVQYLTEQTSDIENPLTSKYLPSTTAEQHLAGANDDDLRFQAMLISTFAFCCSDSRIWSSYSEVEDASKPDDVYTSTKNQVQGFVSLDQIFGVIWNHGQVLYDLKWNKGGKPLLDFSRMNLNEAGFHNFELKAKTERGYLFTDEEIKAAGFSDDQATETSNWLDPWATKQKIWQAWCDTASDAELQLQSSYLRLLTSLYLNNKVLPPTLEKDRDNPLPEFVNLLLSETVTFNMEEEGKCGLGTMRKARMSGAVLPLLYAYFKTVHPKHNHAGSDLKELRFSEEPQSEGVSPIQAFKKIAEAANTEVSKSNLPVPGTPEVRTKQGKPKTLDTSSVLTILMCQVCYRKNTKAMAILALKQKDSGKKSVSKKQKERTRQRSPTTESRIAVSDDDVYRNEEIDTFGHELKNKHVALELLVQRMTQEEDVLFVSEAKADILNKQREALGMKPVPDKARVPLLSFLVFEVQKLELAPRWPKDKKEPWDKSLHDFFGKQTEHKTTPAAYICSNGASDDKGEKHGWISPLFPSYEEFLQKMINHVKDFMKAEVVSGYNTRTVNIRIMQILTELLKDSDPDSEDDGSIQMSEEALDTRKEELDRYSKKQLLFGNLGAVSLVIDVISDSDPRDQETLCAALELGTQLLNGGNENVQALIIDHFEKNYKDGHEFFIKIKEHLEGIGKTMQLNPSFIKEYEQGESNDPTSVFGDKITLIFGFLQLWAEGHNRKMQEFLLGQDLKTVALKKSTNIVALVVKVFDILTADADALRSASYSSLELLEKNMAFIVEVMQGPCTAVQNFVVDDTAIVVYAKRVITLAQKKFDLPKLGKLDEDIKLRKMLMKTLIKAIQLITSLMEGRGGDEDQKVYNEVLESMSSSLFKGHIKKAFKYKDFIEKGMAKIHEVKLKKTFWGNIAAQILDFCWRQYTGSTGTPKVNHVEEKAPAWITDMVEAGKKSDLETVLDLVKESAVELYTVFMQLASIDSIFMKEVSTGDPDFNTAHSYFEENIKSIEFIWSGPLAPPGTQGRVDRLYFQLPPSSKALTAASKTKLSEEVDMDTDENKKRDFLSKSKDLVAEMQRLDQISKNVYFRLIQQNVGEIRNITFSISVCLNILLALSVSGGGNSGFDNQFPEGYDYSNVHIRMGAPRHLFFVLCSLVIVGYMLCFIYQMAIRAPLIRANYLRKRKQKAALELDDDNDDDDDDDADTRDKSQDGGSKLEDENGEASDNAAPPRCRICCCCCCCCANGAPGKAVELQDQLDKAAHEASEKLKQALGKLAGNQRLRRYIWKLITVWFPFLKAVAGLMVLVVIVSFTPSSPDHSPAEWKWIILAIFIGTFNVFFPTLMNFINELKYFPELDQITFGGYSIFVRAFEEFGAVFTAMTELENLVPFVMMYFAIHGVFRFYMCSLLLLDVIFLNERLKNVIRAVTYTATDLAVTFILMAFVVFIFTSFGMYEFGEMIWYESDEFQAVEMDDKSEDGFPKGVIYSRDDDSVAFSLCPNLAVCFLEFFDSGLRSGDIVDAVFDDLTYRDNMMGYFGRIVFGLAFFLIIGVILFDIVTGIIIDKFGELREVTAARLEKIKNSTFIADIDRSTCDENGLDFDDINNHDQDMWNYVYLMAYLEFKDEDEYTGAESMVFAAINNNDISWMPQKICWKMQLKNISAELEESDDIISQAKDEIISDTETRLGDFGTHKNLVAFLTDKFDDVAQNMKKVDELMTRIEELESKLAPSDSSRASDV